MKPRAKGSWKAAGSVMKRATGRGQWVRSGSHDPGPGGSNSRSSILISVPAAMLIFSPLDAAPSLRRPAGIRLRLYPSLDKILVSVEDLALVARLGEHNEMAVSRQAQGARSGLPASRQADGSGGDGSRPDPRANQRRRTKAAIMEGARTLLREGKVPSVADAAEAAG